MYNANGPPGGSNVTANQSSYDLLYRDVILNSVNGTLNTNSQTVSFNMSLDNVNNIYKAELTAATVHFQTSIPTNIRYNSLIVSIPQLNGKTLVIAGNTSGTNINQIQVPGSNPPVYTNVSGTINSQGNNQVQGEIFCQIPDFSSALTLSTTDTISLYIGPHMYESIQYYNPPISKINRLDIQLYDQYTNLLNINPTIPQAGDVLTFYFTLRIYYLQKRNTISSISIPLFTYGGTGTMDSSFVPMNN